MQYISIAQVNSQPNTQNFVPPWYLTTFGGLVLGACLTYFIQKSIARYNSRLTQMRDKEKKLEEKMEEFEEMKGARLILEAIGASETALITKIEGVETKLTQKIEGVETKLTQKIEGVETKLTQKIEGVETKLTQKIDDVAKNVLDIKSNQIALVSELLALNVIKNTPILK
jgi:predicted  nucleic acid-binding Zn-ribbon protein